jgi:hypothetical protein
VALVAVCSPRLCLIRFSSNCGDIFFLPQIVMNLQDDTHTKEIIKDDICCVLYK